MKVKNESEVVQSCPTLSEPTDCSLPGFSIHGIFQAGILEWGAIAFSELLLWETLNTEGSGRHVWYIILIPACILVSPPFEASSFPFGELMQLQFGGFSPMEGVGPVCKAPLWRSIPGLMVLGSHFWGGLAIWFLDFCASLCHLLCFWWLPIAWFDLVCLLWFVLPDFWH